MSRTKGRKPVVVVAAPHSAFPDFSSFGTSKPKKDAPQKSTSGPKAVEFEFEEAVKEIHQLGSTQFTGKKKKQYEAEQYKLLTGREKKKQKVPVKIVRGIKKAALKREKRLSKEAKESGIVTVDTKTKNSGRNKKSYSEQNRRDSRLHGPAPSAGFMSKGMLRVSKNR